MSGKILVTGATGFTGRAICERLIKDGEQVVAFVRSTSKTDDLKKMGVECRVVDITNPDDVRRNFEAFRKVFHIAAAFRTEHSELEEFRRVNVGATRNLLEAARDFKVGRFIHCSTVGVQGEIDDPPASEDYRMKPGDHYQVSKMEGELLARDYFRAGLPGTIVRPVGIYGPGDTRFLKLFKPIARGRFVLIGSGKTLYHMTYIDDLVDGFMLASDRPEALGEAFTIGGERFTTMRELVDEIADVLGVPPVRWRVPYFPVYVAAVICAALCKVIHVAPPLYPRRVEFFAKSRAFSIEKAKKLLGFSPKVSLREGLRRTAEFSREHNLL